MSLKLYNYQHRTAEFCKGKRSVILSVGVGLGKSVSTLVYLNSININSCLIVAPKLVAEKVWLQEMEKWGFTAMREKFTLVAGTKAQRMKAIRESRFLIIGRDNLADVQGQQFDVLVMDEDPAVRSNRLGLLAAADALYRQFCDFSKLVI